MPLLVAPVAFQRVAHPDGEVGMARAAAAVGHGDVPVDARDLDAGRGRRGRRRRAGSSSTCSPTAGVTRELVAQAVERRLHARSSLTVDAPVLGRRERDLRTGFDDPAEITVAALRPRRRDAGTTAFASMSSRRDLARPRAARVDVAAAAAREGHPHGARTRALACEHGAAGVVVSNHGGRQLDGVAATIDALPEVVEAVDGRIEVLLDGGIRRGTDVVKALALGARAVLAGRAPLWGLAVGGEAGRTLVHAGDSAIRSASSRTGPALGRPAAGGRESVRLGGPSPPPGTWNGCLHVGHCTRLPAALSGTCIALPQAAFGHLMTTGIGSISAALRYCAPRGIQCGAATHWSILAALVRSLKRNTLFADANQVAGLERRFAFDLLIVDERAARRLQILQIIAAAVLDDVGVRLLDAGVAEQGDVAPFGAADRRLVLLQQHLAARSEAGFDLDPRFLQDNLRQADEQADAGADGDKSERGRTPEALPCSRYSRTSAEERRARASRRRVNRRWCRQ